MGIFDHWHPVLATKKLRKKPVGIKLAGRQLCLFRTADGAAACVDDVCPHRRSKLSFGSVVGDRLQCKYHGWTFDACGNGESPGTPKMTTCTAAFDVRDEQGYLWV